MYYMILSSKKMTSWKKLAELITVPYNIPLKNNKKTWTEPSAVPAMAASAACDPAASVLAQSYHSKRVGRHPQRLVQSKWVGRGWDEYFSIVRNGGGL